MTLADQGGSYGGTVSLSVSPDMAVGSRVAMHKADPADVTGVDLTDNIAPSDAYATLA
jgi:hypothetical protein